MATILIVDDESAIREGMKVALNRNDYRILLAEDGLKALRILQNEHVDLLISDIKMPKMDGLSLQDEALKLNPNLIIILLTAYGSVETAVEAMRRGAYDFLTKPINLDEFEMKIKKALEKLSLTAENKLLKNELKIKKGLKGMIGNSKVMHELFEKIKVIGETKSTCLITGESGTGKELIASAIHELSPMKNGPFITVNCAALSENLLESELFGHEKGAFTGALIKKEGRFKVADGGTLFLDEIGEISTRIQVKLLRVIQEKTFESVGSNKTIKVDTRFIVATNKKLEELVKEGKFREDLFFRLNVFKIETPPLRDRKEDIPLLADYFVNEYCNEMGKKLKTISPEALKILIDYNWPGNVREFKNTIENMIVFSKGDIIHSKIIPENILHPINIKTNTEDTLNVLENEKQLIIKALEECKYNKTEAAKKLGMSRRTIHRKIKEFELNI